MKYLAIFLTALTVLLTGCATTIRSDVTAFHDWPAQLHDQSYVFEAPAPTTSTWRSARSAASTGARASTAAPISASTCAALAPTAARMW